MGGNNIVKVLRCLYRTTKLICISIPVSMLMSGYTLSDSNVEKIASTLTLNAQEFRLYGTNSSSTQKPTRKIITDHKPVSVPENVIRQETVSLTYNGSLTRGRQMKIWLNNRPLELVENVAGIDTVKLHSKTNTLFVLTRQEKNVVLRPGETVSIKSKLKTDSKH